MKRLIFISFVISASGCALVQWQRDWQEAHSSAPIIYPQTYYVPQPIRQPVMYQQMGPYTFGTDGSMYQQMGTYLYGNDGSMCQQLGIYTFCN